MPSNGPIRVEVSAGKTLIVTGPADITQEETEAIVNAANASLMRGAGVCGAIFAAGGPEIERDCERIRAQQGPLPTGQAVATTGGRLKAKYVIHAVGPVWSGGSQGEPEALASCHRESIRVADELRLRTIAFPAISTGIYGYPVELAASVAVGSAAQALATAAHVDEVRFVMYDDSALRQFADAVAKLSGKAQSKTQ